MPYWRRPGKIITLRQNSRVLADSRESGNELVASGRSQSGPHGPRLPRIRRVASNGHRADTVPLMSKVLISTEDAHIKSMSAFETMSVFAGLLCD
jgi:hypothetical protein